jgi:hypothetical protein
MVKTKLKITEIVLKQIPEQVNYNLGGRLTPHDFLLKWWYTGRGDSFRLTPLGEQAFLLAEIEYYEYPLPSYDPTPAFKLELSKKIKCPYYLDIVNKPSHKPKIRLYDSRIAVMVSLYGSFKDYLESVKLK